MLRSSSSYSFTPTLFAAVLLAARADAQTCPSGTTTNTLMFANSTPPMGPAWSNLPLPVPCFDVPFATLIRADIVVDLSVSGGVAAESQSTLGGCPFLWTCGSSAQVDMPIGPPRSLSATLSGMDSLGAFDGVLDFRGTSGVTHSNLSADDQTTVSITDPALLAAVFTGPGNLGFSSSAMDHATHSGCGSLIALFENTTSIQVSVTYTYCVGAPGTPYCAGDGALATGCPCNNTGQAGRGCENSGTTGGAKLFASGSVNADSVVLTSSGELPTSTSIFLQGTASDSNGIVFGDGVRCVGGTLKRLYVKNANAGAVSAPTGSDPSITARSASLGDPIAPGTPRYYQVYYRDPNASFCPPPQGDAFNVSNAVRVVW